MHVSQSYRVFILAILTLGTMATVGCKSHKQTGLGETTTDSRKPLTSPGEIRITSFEATAASGQPSPYDGTEVAALDVAGVRLGMTPEQTVAALKSFDSGLYFSKRYITDTNTTAVYGKGEAESDKTKKAPYRQFIGIVAAKGTTFLGGEHLALDYSGQMRDPVRFAGTDGDDIELPGDNPEIVSVYFSLDPGNHRVIAVSLREQFKAPRTVSSIIDSVEHKYPKDITISKDERTHGGSQVLRYWRYDSRMRLMSDAAAKQEWHGEYSQPYVLDSSGLPSQIYESDTVALDAGVNSIRDNNQLTDVFGIVLYDESALYRSLGLSDAFLKKFKADQVQKQADSSKDSSAPVKF
jgi:hypothetical protein